MGKVWAGIDAGKEFHWAHVLDASGMELLSRRVENDEADILRLVNEALSFAEEVLWAVDQPGGGAALLLALLWERNQRVLYVPGLTVDRARDAYRGESKTDARDARVIADQARMRSGLGELKAGEEELAEDILGLKERINTLDEELRQRFFARPEARILASLPSMGPILGAEFLVAVGDICAFESADRLAAYAGLVPAARDSGKRVGNHRRMRGGNKTLKRVFYQSAFASLRSTPESRAFFLRAQEGRGQETHSGSHRAGASEGQRGVGDAA